MAQSAPIPEPAVVASPLPPSDTETSRGRILLLALLLVGGALVAYANSLTTPFIFDDRKWILDTPQARNIAADWRRLEISQRPLLMLSLAANYELGYLDVRGYHLFNLVIHIIAGLLLFGIVRRSIALYGGRHGWHAPAAGLAFVSALLWLVHPLQTESVTYIIQRCESMMGMFFLLCLYSVIRGAQSTRAWPWHVAALAACVLGLGCKEVMVAAPPVILLYDRVFLSASWREVARRRGWLHALLFGSAVALVLAMLPSIRGSRDASAGFGAGNMTAWTYLQSQAAILLHYLRLAFWPRPLCLDYDWQPVQSLRDALPAGAAICGLLAGSLLALRYRPWVGFLGLSFFLVLAPTSSVMPIIDLAVEHRMYLPLAAVIVLTVVVSFATVRRLVRDVAARRLLCGGVTLFVALVLIGWTVQRNADYGDPVRMWSKVVEVAPHNSRGHLLLGTNYDIRGDAARAQEHFERAVALAPDYPRPHMNLGLLLIRQGDLKRGEHHLRRALQLNPRYSLAMANLGNVLARREDWRGAIDYYRRALELEPYRSETSQNLAAALLHMGKPSEAVTALRTALRLNPHSGDLRLRLAWVLATCEDDNVRDGAEALRLALEARAQAGDENCLVLDALAAAYAELGQYERASETAARCLELARAKGLNEDLEHYATRLATYHGGKPFRDREAVSPQAPQPISADGDS